MLTLGEVMALVRFRVVLNFDDYITRFFLGSCDERALCSSLNFQSVMNGMNNVSNTKTAVNKSTTVNQNTAQPIPQSSNNSATPQKPQTNASATASNGSTRTTNGEVNSAGPNKAKKASGPTINSSEVHELVQSRIAALEGEKVQGGEEDRRSGNVRHVSL
jgi:hypothetical protein